MKILRMTSIALVALVLLGGCNCMKSSGAPSATAQCITDSDCVPATCCHATACVAKSDRPDCDGAFCTMNCEPETIDCGGGCVCQSGTCAAKLNDLD